MANVQDYLKDILWNILHGVYGAVNSADYIHMLPAVRWNEICNRKETVKTFLTYTSNECPLCRINRCCSF